MLLALWQAVFAANFDAWAACLIGCYMKQREWFPNAGIGFFLYVSEMTYRNICLSSFYLNLLYQTITDITVY